MSCSPLPSLASFRLPVDPDIDVTFQSGMIPSDSPFSWHSLVEEDPKGWKRSIAVRTWKNLVFRSHHTGGFVRIFTERGLCYWLTQISCEHVTPDWKLHFSVDLAQIATAWAVIAGLFIENSLEIGMKATYVDPKDWPASQRGREITLYIYVHDEAYDRLHGREAEISDNPALALGTFFERGLTDSDPFWADFIVQAEQRLEQAGVRSRGCADGDLALPGCSFTSLRNEAFVRCLTTGVVAKVDGSTEEEARFELGYPPNAYGFNAANHRNPLEHTIKDLFQRERKRKG
jgi:hypothetical protein